MIQMTRRKMKIIAMNDSDEESNREDEKIDDSDDGGGRWKHGHESRW